MKTGGIQDLEKDGDQLEPIPNKDPLLGRRAEAGQVIQKIGNEHGLVFLNGKEVIYNTGELEIKEVK